MFNALIAIMGDTFERVQQNKNASGLHSRAKLVLEIEDFMWYDSTLAADAPAWQTNLRVLLSMAIPYHTTPRYLHVLQPKMGDEQGSEWQGRMRVMFQKFDTIADEQQQLQSKHLPELGCKMDEKLSANQKATEEGIEKLVANQKAMEERIDTNQQTTAEQVGGIEQKIDRLEVMLQAILSASQMTDADRVATEEQRRVEAAAAEATRIAAEEEVAEATRIADEALKAAGDDKSIK